MTVADLPAVNACLNSLSAAFLMAGFVMIKRKRKEAHRACMVAAFFTSAIFLVSYLSYHALSGSTKFQGEGWIRPVYFAILITHSILAAAIVPLVLITFRFALKERFEAHRKIARWTWPIWMYVSITGVVVYLLLYQLYPAR